MSKFFINHPIVAVVIAIFFIIAGAVMVSRLPVAQFPDIVPPEIQTAATYPGADALTVEGSVATPIEEQVNGAKNMIYMQSINGDDGTMTLQANFEVGTDVNQDQILSQMRSNQASSQLPQPDVALPSASSPPPAEATGGSDAAGGGIGARKLNG